MDTKECGSRMLDRGPLYDTLSYHVNFGKGLVKLCNRCFFIPFLCIAT
jgi:hypothetical protein